jgi:membrane protein implicated in regulation of membrane protease activity
MIMKKIIQKIKNEIQRLISQTPKVWNWIAGIAAGVPTLVTVINSATAGAMMPDWYTKYQFYVLAVAAVVAYFAKRKTVKSNQDGTTN